MPPSRLSTDSNNPDDDDDIPRLQSAESQNQLLRERTARKRLEMQNESQELQLKELKGSNKEHESHIYESRSRLDQMEFMQKQILESIEKLTSEVGKYNTRLNDGAGTFGDHDSRLKILEKDKEERDEARRALIQKLLLWLIPFVIISALITAASLMGYSLSRQQPQMQPQKASTK